MISEVQALIRTRNSAFILRDSSLYSTATVNLRRGFEQAKEGYRRSTESFLTVNNPHQLWRGIKALTNYKRKSSPTPNSSLKIAEELNLD